ncbi:MAG: periplasmic heavy metal sensor [Phycisphaerae bacterium]|nr:periplasmic heavy metal sensor [Phycisphaerae bacterium]
MRAMIAQGGIVWILLAASLAFNIGFGAMFGVRAYERQCQVADEPNPPCVLVEQLGLSQEQADLMRGAQTELLQKVNELGEQVATEHDRLVGLLLADEPDRQAIDAQLDTIATLQRGIQACVVEHLIEGRGLLEPEQRGGFDRIIRVYVCPRGGQGCGQMPGGCQPSCGPAGGRRGGGG